MRRIALLVGLGLTLWAFGPPALAVEGPTTETPPVAAEAAPVGSPAEAEPKVESASENPVVWAGPVVKGIGWVLLGAAGLLFAFLAKKNAALKEAMQILEGALQEAWERLEPELNRMLADGKLDPDERAKLRSMVWDEVKKLAKGAGGKALFAMAKPCVMGLIDRLICRKAKEVKDTLA